MLLAFDTSTSAVTVALHDGHEVMASSTVIDALRHGELLAPGIASVLAQAGATPAVLTRIAVGVGPGPFTGLRVGIVTARTMGVVLGIAVDGVCSLDILAAEVSASHVIDGPFVVATDARRKEVYWAAYDAHGVRLDGPHVDRPAVVGTTAPVAGRGALLYPDAFSCPAGPQYPDAAFLARAVAEATVELTSSEPLYLRRPDAVESDARKRVL
ncbi:MAG: tRNA (adenosine(37)-N6)-threonylcarbamoyltransferase complex dimerization subunit type 1 TsaB [Propionibacteriales bacterium]|nr:tRNA (adenosine(37)-N6)-threonylcarbamoyltransferase complex dimerization subunit type 1 TsaB [Propionibacteriales bacterium]